MLGRLTRRDFLKVGAGAGALLIARPTTAWGAPTDTFPTSRKSRLFPADGTFAVHSDLHNHSLMSDGAAVPEEVFGAMRAASLDVAAMTDHANLGWTAGKPCSHGDTQCNTIFGITEDDWQVTKQLADGADQPGSFVAMRGFEWTTPTVGHINVWFTEEWVDAFVVGGNQSMRGLNDLFAQFPDDFAPIADAGRPVISSLPDTASIAMFYEWLNTQPGGGPFGGGADGIAGFNHPNEYGNFESYRFVPEVAERIVSCEVLNMERDFMFWRQDESQPSPINACLNAGWRVGLLGVSDEHQTNWNNGRRARGGLWVRSLDRAGVREAMVARRMYATFVPGLRLDAAANGTRMGQTVGHRSGPVRFDVDLDAGSEWHGRRVRVQVVRPGTDEPTLALEQEITLPSLAKVTVPVDVEDGRWAFVRITDPTKPADEGTPAPFAAAGRAVAYSSPFWFDPNVAASVAGRSFAEPAPVLAATGGAGALTAGAAALAAALAARRAAPA